MIKAMIFAAGIGSRLRPLTNHLPKALVLLGGKSLLQHTIEKLIKASVSEIVINIHHFPDIMRQAIEKLDYPEVKFHISDETTELLDTGGGLLKAADLLRGDAPFIAHNVDVISDIDLRQMYNYHLQSKALATLATSNRKTARYFLWDDRQLCGWQNLETGQKISCFNPQATPTPLAFSGIHIVSPEIFDLIEENGKFSINQVYLRLASTQKIIAYNHNPNYWMDVGTIEKLERANTILHNNPGKF